MVRFVCWEGAGGMPDSRCGTFVDETQYQETKGRWKRLVLLHDLYVRSMYVADSNKYDRVRRRGDSEGVKEAR